MLCTENDDQTAERLSSLIEESGLRARDILPWNAYPWYINRKPLAFEIGEASGPLLKVIQLLPSLEVIMLQGADAGRAWRRALATQPKLREKNLTVIQTYHPSNQALWSKVEGERERRSQHRIDSWLEAARILGG
jgi:hypothetical protein